MTIIIDSKRDALLIVDLQPDFMPGGALPIDGGDEVVRPIAALVEGHTFQAVVATQDWHPSGHISFASSQEGREPFDTIELYGHHQVLWPDHCVQTTPGGALHSGLPRAPISAIIRKGQDPRIDSYSGFRDNHGPGGVRRETGLGGYLRARGVERVMICGLALDVCVAWTALDAAQAGFHTVLLRDLSRPVTTEGEGRAIEEMRASGVIIARSDDVRDAD